MTGVPAPGEPAPADAGGRARALILVRHSLPSIDPERPAHEWPLSPAGRDRSQALAAALAPLRPDAVFSSEEPKAGQTAAIVARRLALPHRRVPELGEHDRRSVPFYPDPREFTRRVEALFARPHERVFGGESAEEALARFARGIEAVLDAPASRPVVVSHGTVLSLYLAPRLGRSAADLWREWSMPSWVVLGPGEPAPAIRAVGGGGP